MKELSRVQSCASSKSTICLLLSICLMSWKITCVQMATVGVQLLHCGSEKLFTVAQFKGKIKLLITHNKLSSPSEEASGMIRLLSESIQLGQSLHGGVLDQRFTPVLIKYLVILQGQKYDLNIIYIIVVDLSAARKRKLCETKDMCQIASENYRK